MYLQRSTLALALLAAVVSLSAAAQQSDITLRINGRPYVLAPDTPVSVDGTTSTLGDIEQLPEGLQVRWTTTVGPRGQVPELVFSYTLIGVVTGQSPLRVLGQGLTVTADTELEGLSDPTLLEIGTPVVVAGTLDSNGSLLATLVELRDAPPARFLLSGVVAELGPETDQLRVGEQRVSLAGVVVEDCLAAAPEMGEYLQLRADGIADFAPGDLLDTVTDAACATPVPPGTVGAVGFLQGMVTAVAEAGDSFDLGGIIVDIDGTTQFEFGSVDELDAGMVVEVDGTYTEPTRFAADSVAFSRPLARFEAALEPQDVVPGEQMLVFGIPVRSSAQVRDDDGVLASGIVAPTQLRVRAFIDTRGELFATRVTERGAPDPESLGLRAAVDSIVGTTLYVLGLTIDTSGAEFFDAAETPISADQFFAALQAGDVVDVDEAAFDPASGTFSGGAITLLGAEARPAAATDARGTTTIRSGTAGGLGEPELLLRDGFEDR